MIEMKYRNSTCAALAQFSHLLISYLTISRFMGAFGRTLENPIGQIKRKSFALALALALAFSGR